MDTAQTLQEFGLDEKESKVYLSLLQLGEGSVLDISKRSQIKRPTTYLILAQLEKQSLVSKKEKSTLATPGAEKKTLYRAESPSKLIDILNKKKTLLENILPSLLSIHNVSPEKPRMYFFEGKTSLHQLYRKIAAEAQSEILRFGNLYNLKEQFNLDNNLLLNIFIQTNTKVRDLVGLTEFERRFCFNNIGINYRAKHCQFPLKFNAIFYNNKIALFSLDDDFYALVIEDRKIVRSLKGLYELAWQTGIEPGQQQLIF